MYFTVPSVSRPKPPIEPLPWIVPLIVQVPRISRTTGFGPASVSVAPAPMVKSSNSYTPSLLKSPPALVSVPEPLLSTKLPSSPLPR